jgi:hypothetical protein
MTRPETSHRLGFALLLAPGAAACLFALLADVLRGSELVANWGSGQSVLLLFGVVMLIMGSLIHRKAIADERNQRRRYARTLIFILVPLAMLVVLPLGIAEAVARFLPAADDTNTSYRQRDPRYGFSIAPSRQYHVVSRPKNFDIRVRIDAHGNRMSAEGSPPLPSANVVTLPSANVVTLPSANVVTVGDSHPFGFGVAEDQTLAAHLHDLLRQSDRPANVLNAGVPGFGPGQTLLRMRSFQGSLSPGAVIVVFINPMNDLVNLSSAVDYHYPKPHATIVGDELVFQSPPSGWGEGAFLFSKPFESLNQFFGLADRRKWYHSALYRRLSHSSVQPPVVDGVTQLVDPTSPQQYVIDDAARIAADPMLYASRFWTEMPRFTSQRQYLAKLVTAVFAEMQATADAAHWHLIVVVAPEAYQYQAYSTHFIKQVQAVIPDSPIEYGWSRDTVRNALESLAIATVAPDYTGIDPEPRFVQNDEHTSGIGHRQIARQVVETIDQHSSWSQTPGDQR